MLQVLCLPGTDPVCVYSGVCSGVGGLAAQRPSTRRAARACGQVPNFLSFEEKQPKDQPSSLIAMTTLNQG